MISDAAIEKMSAIQIRDLIAEVNHQVFHLERSQRELEEALKDDPDDRDFKFAYFENVETIGLKKETIVKLETRLKDIDVARCMEELAFERQQVRENVAMQVLESAIAVSVEGEPTRDSRDAGQRDRSGGPQWAEEDEYIELPTQPSATAPEKSVATADTDEGLYL
eukprot:gene36872-44733_t